MASQADSVEDVAQVLDDLAGVSFRSLRAAPPRGYYEAELDADLRLRLVRRHVEAVAALARDDLRFLPPAMTLARASYEIALRILWLLNPDAPFDREARWLAYLHDRERYHERFAKRVVDAGGDPSANLRFAEQVRKLRTDIAARLPTGIEPPAALPTFASMLLEIGEKQKYLAYMALSQYGHGTHQATDLYRHQIAGKERIGDRVSDSDWLDPLQVAWFSVEQPTIRLLEVVGGDTAAFRDQLPVAAMDAVVLRLRRLRSSKGE